MSRVGSVSVAVVPDASRFTRDLRTKLVPQAEKLGEQLGKKIGDAVEKHMARGMRRGMAQGGRDAKAEGAKTGEKYGSEFGRMVKRRLEVALRDLPDAKIELNKTALNRELVGVRAEMKTLERDVARIRVRVDDARAIADLEAVAALAHRIDGTPVNIDTRPAVRSIDVGRKHMRLWVQAAIALSPALIPLVEGLAAPTIGVVAALSAAGTAAVAFAAVAIPAFLHINEAIYQVQKRGAAAFDGLSDSEKTLFAAEQSIKASWNKLNETLQPIVLPVITSGFELARRHMADLIPLVEAGAEGFQAFEQETAKAFAGHQWRDFIGFVSRQAPEAFRSLTTMVWGLAEGFGNMFQAIEPVLPDIDAFIARVGTGFRDWTSSDGFYAFLEHTEAILPDVARFLRSTAREAGGLLVALEPFGIGLMGGLADAFDSLADLNPRIHDLAESAGDLLENIEPTVDAIINLGGTGVLGALNAVASVLNNNVELTQTLFALWTGRKIANMIVGLSGVQKLMGAISKAGAGGAVKTLGKEAGKSTGVVAGLTRVLNPAALATFGLTAAISGGILLWQHHRQAVLEDKKAVDDYAKNIQSKTDMMNPKSLTSAAKQLESFGKGLTTSYLDDIKQWKEVMKGAPGLEKITPDEPTKLKEFNNTVLPQIALYKQLAQALAHLQEQFATTPEGISGMLGTAGITPDELERYSEAYRELATGQKRVPGFLGLTTGVSFGDIIKDAFAVGKLEKQITASNDAMRNASNPAYLYKQALEGVLEQAGKTVDPIDALNDALTNFAELQTGMLGSNAETIQAIRGIDENLSKTGKDGKKYIDLAGVSIKQVLTGNLYDANDATVTFAGNVAQMSQKLAANESQAYKNAIAHGHNEGALKKVVKQHDQNTAALERTWQQEGLTKEQTQKLIDKYFQIPDEITTAVRLNGLDEANSRLADLHRDLDQLHDRQFTIKMVTQWGGLGPIGGLGIHRAEGGPILSRAGGGPIRGAGTSTSDSIPLMGSNGEYVVKARSVAKYGMDFMDALNEGRLRTMSGGGDGLESVSPVSIGTWNNYSDVTADEIGERLWFKGKARGGR